MQHPLHPDFFITRTQGKRRGKRQLSEVFFHKKKYSIEEIIGSGSYGVVCSATDNETKKKVAIKKIKNVTDDNCDAQRVLREMRILRHLSGKEFTIEILDAFSFPPDTPNFKDIYIVTQLMESDFDKVLQSSQYLSNDHFAYFLYQLLRSTANMHKSHILHRDLKPANILVNANCDLVVCDFGLSRGVRHLQSSCEKDENNNNHTNDDHLTEYVVTRWYRAPEIIAESPLYGAAADIWSVGCILGEMLDAARLPIFRGNGSFNQMKLIMEALGTPSDDELKFCSSSDSLKMIDAQSKAIKRENIRPWDFSERFPNASSDAIDLLKKMLRFDPRERITAEEALEHPFFASCRENFSSPPKARLFDFSFELAYNLDPDKKRAIPKKDLQNLFLIELSRFCPVRCKICRPLHMRKLKIPGPYEDLVTSVMVDLRVE